MKEIKFRAWVQEREKSKSWMNNDMGVGQIFKIYDNDIFMQYTGLKDKNGKEIYEGDIVRSYHQTGEIEYGIGGYYLKTPMYEDDLYLYDIWERGDGHKIEVIGNIYENQELLIN